MKKAVIIIIVAFGAVFSAAILKDQMIKAAVTVVVSRLTGAPVHIDRFSLGVFNSSVRISGFKMYNPRGFSKGILINLPTINVRCDLGALLKRKLHIPEASIELSEMALLKNREGRLNVDSLKVSGKEGSPKKARSAQMPIQIDTLKLKIGRIIFKDYSHGGYPAIKVYDIGINKEYRNINSVNQLVVLVLSEPMKSAGIEGAKIYAAAMLAGAAVLPVSVAVTLAGKDNAQQVFAVSQDNAYSTSLKVLGQMGRIVKEDRSSGIIEAEVDSTQVSLKINKKGNNRVEIFASARRYLLPRPEIAAGVIYAISEKLK